MKAALTADAKFNGGEYTADDPPVVGLKACARVYAGEDPLKILMYTDIHAACWHVMLPALPDGKNTPWTSILTGFRCGLPDVG